MRNASSIRPHWFARLLLWQGWQWHARWIGLVLLASVLQGVVAPRLAIWGAIPDVTMVVLACIALRTNPTIAVWAGFLSGLIEASLQNQLMGSLIVSRVIASYGTAFLKEFITPERRLSAVLAVIVLSVLSQGLLYLFAPSAFGRDFFGTQARVLVYNIGVTFLAFGLFWRWVPLSLLEEDQRYGTFRL